MKNHNAYFNPVPEATGIIKTHPEDFQVTEQLSFELTGEGEHVYLYCQKRNMTTLQLAKQLAKFANIHPRDVGYAGMKDRQGVTQQWFSLYLPGREALDWQALTSDDLQILTITAHQRKCRIGSLTHNDFVIVIRDLQRGEDIPQRLATLMEQGMPNYVGEQRFGHQLGNIEQAKALLDNELTVKNKRLKGIYYSTARSLIFNALLSARVEQGCFNQGIDGDMLQHVGRRACFSIDAVDEIIQQRIAARELVPAGPLWGQGEHHTSLQAKAMEDHVLTEYYTWLQGLEAHGLELAYRPYTVFPLKMAKVGQTCCEWLADDCLKLQFRLPRGAYATSLLRELGQFSQGERLA